ncbi:MAG: 50S ribosomal protein L24 [Desulfobulbus propionicus]|nr:MAG: 50S ribosomal protein L24 [Desulfobulbus propionicus]
MRQGQTKLLKNDQVEVIAGKDKGRVGKILSIDYVKNRAVVERINMIKKHQKPVDATQPGQIIDREASVHLSNLMLVCPECTETVRIGKKYLEDGTKVRVCRRCDATIETAKK